MAIGVEIRNRHDTVLIDDTYRNMAVVNKGTQANPPSLVANTMVAYRRTSATGGNYAWWRFGYPQPPNTSGWAIQVRNAANQITFDSRLQYARIVDEILGPLYEMPDVVKAYPAGRIYAAVAAKRSAHIEQEIRPDPTSPPGWYNYRRRLRSCVAVFSGTTLTLTWSTPAFGEWSLPIQVVPQILATDNKSRFIIVDVTGY